jgi:ribose transport system permease protein
VAVLSIARQPEFVMLAATVLLTLVVTIRQPLFLSPMNVISILTYVSFTGMIAIPMVLLLVARMLDMSIGAVTAFLSAILAILCKNLGVNPYLSLMVIVAVGLAVGLLNGFLIINFRINAFILTLAMLFLYRGLVQVIQVGRNIVKLPRALLAPAEIQPLGLPLSVYALVLIVVAGWVVLHRTPFGKNVYILGNSEVIAVTSGINIGRTVRTLYMLVGAVCAVCAYFVTIHYRVANVTTGTGWEFEVISGCMLGGCSMYGGKGTIAGGILGILFMTVLRYTLQTFNIVSGYQIVVTGVVLVFSVLIDTLRMKRLVG